METRSPSSLATDMIDRPLATTSSTACRLCTSADVLIRTASHRSSERLTAVRTKIVLMGTEAGQELVRTADF